MQAWKKNPHKNKQEYIQIKMPAMQTGLTSGKKKEKKNQFRKISISVLFSLYNHRQLILESSPSRFFSSCALGYMAE